MTIVRIWMTVVRIWMTVVRIWMTVVRINAPWAGNAPARANHGHPGMRDASDTHQDAKYGHQERTPSLPARWRWRGLGQRLVGRTWPTALVLKRRDEGTDARVALEAALR